MFQIMGTGLCKTVRVVECGGVWCDGLLMVWWSEVAWCNGVWRCAAMALCGGVRCGRVRLCGEMALGGVVDCSMEVLWWNVLF